VKGSCEHRVEPSGSIKYWEILEWLLNWRLLKKGSAPRVSESEKYKDDSSFITLKCIISFKLSYTIQVTRNKFVFDQCKFRLIRSQIFIRFPLYVPIMKQQKFNNGKRKERKKSRLDSVAHKQYCQIMLLLRHYAAVSSVSLRSSSK
jgi:hypothetical protein